MSDEKNSLDYSFSSAAYGGDAWQGRQLAHAGELGSLWMECGLDSEWRKLKTVLLHQPGEELAVQVAESDSSLLLAPVDPAKAAEEHAGLTEQYRSLGVDVFEVEPKGSPTPNQMFCADLFAMTPQGAILARPASSVRAGEEVHVARRLADMGIPILRTLTGTAVFEGADLMWLDECTAMIGRGHRTNQTAIEQISATLHEIGCDVISVDLPFGTMHFMGMLRIPSKDLAICWPRRTPHATVMELQKRGFRVEFLPGQEGSEPYRAMNFVTLDSGKILMVEGLESAKRFFESLDLECHTSPTDELSKAAGNIGCLTGVVSRELAGK
ncbi:MAG: arginine deiminase family protein [Pseudomonadota bacterium]